MHELWRAGDLVMALVAIASSAGFPPLSAGAFWAIVTIWGIVTVLFDDETPRGVPGMDALRPRADHDTHDQAS